MALDERPVPEPGPDEVLIRVTYAGICGSELNGYLGHNSLLVPARLRPRNSSGVITASVPASARTFRISSRGGR